MAPCRSELRRALEGSSVRTYAGNAVVALACSLDEGHAGTHGATLPWFPLPLWWAVDWTASERIKVARPPASLVFEVRWG